MASRRRTAHESLAARAGRWAWAQSKALARGGWRLLRTSEGRDRIACLNTFLLIIAFAVSSFDYLLMGGPDWIPGPRPVAAAPNEGPLQAAGAVQIEVLPPLSAPDLNDAPQLAAYDPRITPDHLLGGAFYARPASRESNVARLQPASYEQLERGATAKAPIIAAAPARKTPA